MKIPQVPSSHAPRAQARQTLAVAGVAAHAVGAMAHFLPDPGSSGCPHHNQRTLFRAFSRSGSWGRWGFRVSGVGGQPAGQGFQLLQRQRLCRSPAHWRRRLSPAAVRGSGRGHLGRCGNTSGRCLLVAGLCLRKGNRRLGFALVRLEAQGVVLLMHSKKNHKLTDCS